TPLSVTNPLGRVTRNGYDGKNHRVSTVDPLGDTVTNTVDAAGNVLKTTDATGVVTQTNTFDSRGDVTSIADALGQTTRLEYDGAGHQTLIVTPNGHASAYTYDVDGNPARQSVTRTDAGGDLVPVTLDHHHGS